MPLIFSQPKNVSIDVCKVKSLFISLDGALSVSVQYVEGPEVDGVVEPVRAGTMTFSADDYASVDPSGDTYERVKHAAYALLKKHLGAGEIT